MIKKEELTLRTEDFDDEFKMHFWAEELHVDRGSNEEVRTTVFEHKGDCDSTKTFVMLHGATAPVKASEFRKNARDIERDKEYKKELAKRMGKDLRERGELFDKYDTSFRESRRWENATDNWLRCVDKLGAKCPKWIVSISWGDFWILTHDQKGMDEQTCTVDKWKELILSALEKVGANVDVYWLISHSMGGLSSFQYLYHSVKNKRPFFDKVVINDGLLFPADIGGSYIIEALGSLGALGGVASRILVELNLYEHEFQESKPTGRHYPYMINWPPVLLQTNTESMFPFSAKHTELYRIAKSIGANQIHLLTAPCTHSYFDAGAIADFLVNPYFNVKDHEL